MELPHDDLRQGTRVDGLMEKSAAILTDPFHDSNIGVGADGNCRNGDLHLVLHGTDEIDQFALGAPGLSIA